MGEMHCVNGVCEMSSRKSSQMEALDAYIKSLPLADNPTRKRGFLIQTLHKAQSLFGYLPVEVQSFVAERLGISLAEVYGVISFYSFFTDKPIGRYAINVCTGTACFVKGAAQVVDELKRKIAATRLADSVPGLLEGLVAPGDRVVCVCPIDESAPKGRLILPQVQVIRDCLDRHLAATVCQVEELEGVLENGEYGRTLVITDSQAFSAVRDAVVRVSRHSSHIALTSFSILFARQKGDLAEFLKGVDAVRSLKDGDRVLVAEGCTHHRQCNDIGTVKIPKAVAKLSGAAPEFRFSSGGDFPLRKDDALVVQCGGCMLTRREVMRRIEVCRETGVPIMNYGMLLAAANGLSGVRPDGIVEP